MRSFPAPKRSFPCSSAAEAVWRPHAATIPAAWAVTWLLMAALEGRWVTRSSWLAIGGRGMAAAMLSGIAFFLVLDLRNPVHRELGA